MRKAFNNFDFGPMIPIGESCFGKAPEFPKAGEHPRLFFTKEMIPDIRRALDDCDYKAVRQDLDEFINDPFDGILKIPFAQGIPGAPYGRRGIHNFDARGLVSIESKAFAYAVWGDKELGYQAIDAMQNYLLTLNIRFIYCDMCREYGQVMFTVAKVYDWCYDLLTEDEKHRLFAGTINYAVVGTSGMTTGFDMGREGDSPFRNYSGIFKMETGFPPKEQSSIVGHGAEAQILRDFYSAAIAFYDEHPDWWEYIAGRIFNTFLPFRNSFFKSGAAPQGNAIYGPYRTQFDCYAAILSTVLFGKNPYTHEIQRIPRSLYSFELPDGSYFSDGDGVHTGFAKAASAQTNCAFWISSLYKDPVLRAEVKYHRPDYKHQYFSTASLTPAEIMIILSNGIKPAADRHEGVSPVCYNEAPEFKMIARSRWDDPAAPVVYMKAANRWTANHDHGDAGTFQIFYKGKLSIDSGEYKIYGTVAHKNQQATIAHNGVLIHSPKIAARSNAWYTGGQRRSVTPVEFDQWITNDEFKMAEPEGASYAIKDGITEYAYIASDISYAYDKKAEAEYLSRRMLSVFPNSQKNPLVFATFDSIIAKDESCKKAILLHTLPGPRINGNTVTTKNENAYLIANYISDSPLELAYYGEDDNSFADGMDAAIWGRVEVCPKLGNLRDDVLSLMYVKDIDDEDSPKIVEIKTKEVLGAEILGYAILFVRDCKNCPTEISVDVNSSDMYMISGLSVGRWEASVGEKSVSFEVTADERFARLSLPQGRLVLKKR